MVIYSDVWGPSKVPTMGGSLWFITFIYDCTRMIWLCLMRSKNEVNLLFQKFHKMNLVECKGLGPAQQQWWRILKFQSSAVYGSIWNYSSNHLLQYTLTEWSHWTKKSTLVIVCLSFLDSSTYTDILLGRSNYLYCILNQSGTFQLN